LNDQPRESAIISYLENSGRLYADDGAQIWTYTLGEDYLNFGYTLCMSYPFLSIHGRTNTFTEGLWYSFPDSLWSSNLDGHYTPNPGEIEPVLEDDVGCGCVDLKVNRQGYKAVINSQPLHQAIDNENTGTRLEYFRRMLVYFDILTDIKNDGQVARPEKIAVNAYPNPFNTEVTLSFAGSNPISKVNVGIYDITGRQIRTLPETYAGNIIWDGKNNQGAPVTSGVYFVKATSGNQTVSVKLTMLK
jgi:hypothetical protein